MAYRFGVIMLLFLRWIEQHGQADADNHDANVGHQIAHADACADEDLEGSTHRPARQIKTQMQAQMPMAHATPTIAAGQPDSHGSSAFAACASSISCIMLLLLLLVASSSAYVAVRVTSTTPAAP